MGIIADGIAAVNEGIKLVKELRRPTKESNDTEFKAQLIELTDKLLSSKQALQDAQESEFSFRNRIAELEAKLSLRTNYTNRNGLSYKIDDQGNEVGEPFCTQCRVHEEKLYPVQFGSFLRGTHKCNNCQGVFGPKSDSKLEDTIVRVRRSDWDDFP